MLQQKLDHLFSLRRAGGGDLSIRPDFFTLLERLGNPHQKLPPVIHVAGTNGKGSTIAFMRAILESAGYCVHVYTSPHLIRYNERFVVAGNIIDDRTLESLLDEISAAAARLDLAFLEITPALGFLAFSRFDADILLLETGLGGRLDHTNIVENPLLTVITTISCDHTAMLGDTIEKIAFEKAGIMKPNVPCLIGHQIFSEALPVFVQHAQYLNINLIDEEHWPRISKMPTPNLYGRHQEWNAGLAVAALKTQKHFVLSDDHFIRGIQSAYWPGRLQKIETIPLPAGWEFWLDGAHNDSGAIVLSDHIHHWQETDSKPLHVITAMAAHKDAHSFVAPLAPLASTVTTIPIEGGIDPDALAGLWRGAGAPLTHSGTDDGSIADIAAQLAKTGPQGRILLTGSLYLAQIVL